jgi:hypothetical protein
MSFLIFYLILVVQTVLSSAMQPNSCLPQDLCKKISSLFATGPSKVVSLSKFDKCNQNVDEKLHFPSTSSVNFIYNTVGASDAATLLRVKNNDIVVPHIPLLIDLKGKKICINNHLAGMNTKYLYPDANQNSVIFFDESKNNVVVMETNDTSTIRLMSLQKKDAGIKITHPSNWYKWQSYERPLSLCFHNSPSDWICSVVVELVKDGRKQLEKNVQEIMLFSYPLRPKYVSINAEMEIPLIKKHEWIGFNTFLFSTVGQLFFGLYNADKMLFLYEQKFYTSIVIENKLQYKQLSVVSFSANQDSDKKTALGRARFFALLVDNTTKDNQVEQILFLCDLLSPYKSIKRIWSSLDNQDLKEKRFDRISFFDNIISLWENEISSPNALKIELPSDWTDMSERDLLFQQACKKENYFLY